MRAFKQICYPCPATDIFRWITLAALILAASPSARAESEKQGPPPPRNYEVFAGADVASHVWLAYSGVTMAPFTDIHSDGLRLRVSGGMGEYRYLAQTRINDYAVTSFHAQVSYAEALVGYLKRMGALTAKAFVGVSAIEHAIRPLDPQNRSQGFEYGAKAVVELWLNIGDSAWASLDVGWSQAHNTSSGRGRLGYRIAPQLSLGMEAGFNLDRQGEYKITDEVETHRRDAFDYARVGAFARYEWYGGEISASGGLLGDFTEENERSAYATVNWLTQF